MKEDLNMDKTFRDKLDGLSQAPPPHVWDNIQGRLIAQRRKRRIVFFSRIAAAAVILIAFLAGWYINDKSNEIVPSSVKNEIVEKQIQTPKNENELNVASASTKDESAVPEKNELKKTETFIHATDELIAEVNINEIENETGNLNRIERFSLKMLDKMEVVFDFNQIDKLHLKQKDNQIIEISQAEKKLIAENIRLSERADDKTKLKMGLHFSPGYSSQSSNYSEAYSNNMTYSEKSGNGNVGGGFSVQIKTSKKWSVESGIYYAQNGQRSSNSLNLLSANSSYSDMSFVTEKSFFNTTVNSVNGQYAMNSTAGIVEFSGTPEGTEMAANVDEFVASSDVILANGEFSQVFDFIEIPLFLRYNLIDSKIGVELVGGINAGFIAGNKVFMENQYGNQNVGKTKDISSVNLSGTIGVGVNYALGKHVSLAVEPRFNYYMNSINQNPDVDYRPYRIGVYTGLYYQF